MNIEIKRSKKPVNYSKAIKLLEYRVNEIIKINTKKELIWFLEHPSIYTAGSSFNKIDIIDNSITVIKTSRGGKITWHGPGQLICYFVINLNNKKKDIRKFINLVEQSIIDTLKQYNIEAFRDKKNIGIWFKKKNKTKKIGSIGLRVKRWIVYHGFSLNISNRLESYDKIIPCGITDKKVTTLNKIKKQNYSKISNYLEKNLIKNLKNLTS